MENGMIVQMNALLSSLYQQNKKVKTLEAKLGVADRACLTREAALVTVVKGLIDINENKRKSYKERYSKIAKIIKELAWDDVSGRFKER